MKSLRNLLALLFCLATLPAGAVNPVPTLTLLTAAAASSTPQLWSGGIGTLDVEGTWNGATAQLQYVGSDGTTLQPVGTACTLTANGNCAFYLPRALIQLTITGAGGSTSLTASASIVPSLIQ